MRNTPSERFESEINLLSVNHKNKLNSIETLFALKIFFNTVKHFNLLCRILKIIFADR